MSKPLSKAAFKKYMKGLTEIPEGFGKLTWETQTFGFGKFQETELVAVLKKDDGMITLRFDQNGSGHTRFVTDGTEVSFDRLGVEDSFYSYSGWGKFEAHDLNEIVKEQIERVAQYFEYKKTALVVPGLPFTLSPERLASYKKMLSKKQSVSLMPSGFGTGYVIGFRPGFGARPASKELEKFFGFSGLYVAPFDAD